MLPSYYMSCMYFGEMQTSRAGCSPCSLLRRCDWPRPSPVVPLRPDHHAAYGALNFVSACSYLQRRRDRQGPYFTYEVIIVDDGSKDDTVK